MKFLRFFFFPEYVTILPIYDQWRLRPCGVLDSKIFGRENPEEKFKKRKSWNKILRKSWNPEISVLSKKGVFLKNIRVVSLKWGPAGLVPNSPLLTTQLRCVGICEKAWITPKQYGILRKKMQNVLFLLECIDLCYITAKTHSTCSSTCFTKSYNTPKNEQRSVCKQ